ncbi:MAG: LamG domain-containing protein [Balneolales bacterium]
MLYLLFIVSCGERSDTYDEIKQSLSFYASFDESFKADYALGDPDLYTAPHWDQRKNVEIYTDQDKYLQIHKGEGRYKNALWIDSQHDPVFFYKGRSNITYNRQNWSGTISFWIRLHPDEELHNGYSDPIQLTSRTWNDGSIFVDFTDEEPRDFRFAVFADRNVWDSEEREWEEVPIDERPMVELLNNPFSTNEWTHVAMAFSNFNTGSNDGIVYCYINGQNAGILEGHEQTITWDPEEVAIWFGYNFRGYFDEVSIYNRDLTGNEISQIYSLENGIGDLLDP